MRELLWEVIKNQWEKAEVTSCRVRTR